MVAKRVEKEAKAINETNSFYINEPSFGDRLMVE